MSLLHSTSKKQAVVFAYIAIFANTISSIFLTPILLKTLGVEEYGLFQMIYSVGSYILILDLGMATVMVRYISEYRAKGDKGGEENFAAMIGVIALLIAVIMVFTGGLVNSNLENIYKTLTPEEYALSHKMFLIMIVQFVFTIADNYYGGIIAAYERFVFLKLVNLIQIIVSFALTVALVYMGMGALGIVIANLIVISLKFLINFYYAHFILKFRIKLHQWNQALLYPAFGLMLALLLQSVIGLVNQAADKTILGIYNTKENVAIYSVSATIITLFNTLPTVVSGMFQPQVMRMVVKNTSKSQLTDLVIRVGRWQFILTGALLAGFVLFGNDFFTLWVGDKLDGALAITLIIMPFNMIPLIQTVCLSILNAYDKRMSRSLILIGMTAVKIAVSVYLVKNIGVLGAPIGTAFSYLLGHGILMNLYYSKVMKLEVGRMFKEIFSRILPSLLLSMLVTSPFMLWNNISIYILGIKIIGFIMVYAIILYLWGMNADEKRIIDLAVASVKKRRL